MHDNEPRHKAMWTWSSAHPAYRWRRCRSRGGRAVAQVLALQHLECQALHAQLQPASAARHRVCHVSRLGARRDGRRSGWVGGWVGGSGKRGEAGVRTRVEPSSPTSSPCRSQYGNASPSKYSVHFRHVYKQADVKLANKRLTVPLRTTPSHATPRQATSS